MSHAGRVRLTLAAIVAVIAVSGERQYAQGDTQAPNSQPNPYQPGIENYFKLPEGRPMGSSPQAKIDRDGSSVWIFERCGAASCTGSPLAPVLKFDVSGKLVKSFGAGMFVQPHGIYQDREGNIWVTDGQGNQQPQRGAAAGAPLPQPPMGHQVFKFSPDGKLLMTLGKPGMIGDGPDTFNQPSDVLVAPNGDIFVGDGHGGASNARIVKFSKDGKFIKTWGKKGTAPGEFEAPHGQAMDSKGRLFVADRGNNRIQIFDQEGKFLEEWKQFGRPSGVFIDKNDTLYVADSSSSETTNPGWKKGIRIGSAKDGKVVAFIPDPDPNGSQEGVAADLNGNVYGTLTAGQAVKKYVKK